MHPRPRTGNKSGVAGAQAATSTAAQSLCVPSCTLRPARAPMRRAPERATGVSEGARGASYLQLRVARAARTRERRRCRLTTPINPVGRLRQGEVLERRGGVATRPRARGRLQRAAASVCQRIRRASAKRAAATA